MDSRKKKRAPPTAAGEHRYAAAAAPALGGLSAASQRRERVTRHLDCPPGLSGLAPPGAWWSPWGPWISRGLALGERPPLRRAPLHCPVPCRASAVGLQRRLHLAAEWPLLRPSLMQAPRVAPRPEDGQQTTAKAHREMDATEPADAVLQIYERRPFGAASRRGPSAAPWTLVHRTRAWRLPVKSAASVLGSGFSGKTHLAGDAGSLRSLNFQGTSSVCAGDWIPGLRTAHR